MRFFAVFLCIGALVVACDDDTTETPAVDATGADARPVDGAVTDSGRDAGRDATPMPCSMPCPKPCPTPSLATRPPAPTASASSAAPATPSSTAAASPTPTAAPASNARPPKTPASSSASTRPPPLRACPGPGCEADDDPVLHAGAASRVVTPDGFETPTPAGLDGSQLAFIPPFAPGQWNDCGRDGLCPGDDGYLAPDEGEGDGEMQGMWLAGFSTGRPAQHCPPELIGCDGPDCCVSKFAHDDLTVQIAVVRQRGVTVAFAALDAVGYFHTDIEAIRARVEPMGIDLLVMGASHDHEAPDTAGQWGPGDGIPVRTGREAAFLDKIER
jgi:hypothetical protein